MKPWAYQSDQLHAVTIVSHLKRIFDVNRSTVAKIFTSSSYIQFCKKYHVLPCHLFYLDVYACSLGTVVKLKRVSKRFCGTNAAFSVKPRAQALDQLLTVTFVSHFKPTFDAKSSTFAKIFICSSYALFCQKHHVLLCCNFCLNVYFFCIHLLHVGHTSWIWNIHSVYCLQTHHLHTVHCQKIVSDHDNETILHAATTRRRITIWVNQESLGAIRESKHQI